MINATIYINTTPIPTKSDINHVLPKSVSIASSLAILVSDQQHSTVARDSGNPLPKLCSKKQLTSKPYTQINSYIDQSYTKLKWLLRWMKKEPDSGNSRARQNLMVG